MENKKPIGFARLLDSVAGGTGFGSLRKLKRK